MKRTNTTYRYLIALSLIIIAVFAVGMPFGFLTDWDDGVFILKNSHLDFSWDMIRRYAFHAYSDLWTPLPMYSLALDKLLFKFWAPGYHIHNLLLHCGCAITLFLILKKLKCNNLIAFIGSLLWALNPQKVESVIWIVERKDVQCGLLFLAAVLTFLNKHMWWAALFTFLAIASKPATIALPGIFTVYIIFIDKSNWKKALIPIFSGISAFLIGTWITAQAIPATMESNPLVPLHNLFWYPLTALIPFELNPIYPNVLHADGRFCFIVITCVILTITLIYLARKAGCSWPGIIAALLIIGGNTVPVLAFMRYTDYRFCDRYNYLPSVTVIIALAILVQKCINKGFFDSRIIRIPALSISVIAIILYAFKTYTYIPYWRNTQYMTYYALQQPGVINNKLLDVAYSSAINGNNVEYLVYLQNVMKTRKHSYNFDEVTLKLFQLATDGQIAMMQGNTALGRRCYYAFVELSQNISDPSKIMLPKGVKAALYLNLSRLAALDGDNNAAEFYKTQLLDDELRYKRSLSK